MSCGRQEIVDPEKAENVIDAKDVKDLAHLAHALAPPGEVLLPESFVMIERHAPVLSPFCGEGVRFENSLRGRSAAPLVVKHLGEGPNIRAIIADSEGDIPHQRHALLPGVILHGLPLIPSDPLHVGNEPEPLLNAPALSGLQSREPGERVVVGAVGVRPRVPAFRAAVLVDQNAEEGVALEPGRWSFTNARKARARRSFRRKDRDEKFSKAFPSNFISAL